MASGSGLNFRLYARLSVALTGLALALILWPIGQCAIGTLGSAELPDAVGMQVDATVAVVGADDGLFIRLGRGVSECRTRYPVTGAPLWQIGGVGLGFVFFLLFTVIGRIDKTRAVRLQTQKQRQARKQLRREHSSRPTSTSGYHRVPTPLSGAHQIPSRREGSGLGNVLDETDDPLAALDRAIASKAEPAALSDFPAPMTPMAPMGSSRARESDPLGIGAPPPVGPSDAENSLTNLPSLEDLATVQTDSGDDLGGWSPTAELEEDPTLPLGPEPPLAAPDVDGFVRADTDASAPFPPMMGIEDTAPAIQQSSLPAFGAIGEPTLSGAEFVAPVYVGNDIALEIHGTALAAAAQSLEIGLTLEASDGRRAPVWSMARTLATAGSYTETPAGVRLHIPWRSFGGVLLENAREEGISISLLHVSLTLDPRTMRVASPVRDSFVAQVTRPDGAPSEPRTVLLTSASGRAVRGWIGAESPGRLNVSDIEPGTCTIEFDDGTLFSLPGEEPSRSVDLSTAGAGFASPTEGPPPSAAYSLSAINPAVIYVSARAESDPDGTRQRPFNLLGDAVAHVAGRRAAGDRRFDATEIRVDPTAQLPSSRPGLVHASGQSQWLRWWRGEPADQNFDWVRNDQLTRLRKENADGGGLGFSEELTLEGVNDLRIVNSAYAELRDRIARSPGFETRLAAEYGDIPLVLLSPPEGGTTRGVRLEMKDCHRVLIEGVHILGCAGQSGVVVRDSTGITIRRCWVNLFSSGATASGGVFGVGRGIQIDHSGGSNVHEAVRVEHCDIGWNHAARRAVPIRGAGVALYNSNVELIRCYVHHNRATQEPAGLVARGESKVRGEACVRDDNRVLSKG